LPPILIEAEEVAAEEKQDETQEDADKKKGLNPEKGDDALTKLHAKRDKKAKELNKLLKIVDRTKQRMKTDIANLNHLSSDVLALHQEIEYRKKVLDKKGVVVTNKAAPKQDLEMTGPSSASLNSGGYGAPTPSKPVSEAEVADSAGDDAAPHLEPASYNNSYDV